MEAETKIISKHNLDCTSVENLVKDISNRLGWNIEFGHTKKIHDLYEYEAEGSIQIDNSGILSILDHMDASTRSTYNFCLELGDQAIFIYDDFINLMPAI